MNIKTSVTELIGKTPLLQIKKYQKLNNCEDANIIVKLEGFNAAGSVKDRVALSIINQAEEDGILKPGATVIEPTSGNTGIGIASVCAAKGYKAIMVMPSSMSEERRKFIKAYGAEIVLSEASKGMQGAVDKAAELNKEIPNSIIAGQFVNAANRKAHRLTTAPEIYEDLDGKVDIFIAGIGTGGTVSGCGEYLKGKNKNIKVIGIEPATSPLLTQGVAGKHGIQGLGANFVPDNFKKEFVDEVVTITDAEAYEAAKQVAREEGILVGISSGAAIAAAKKQALLPENKGKNIVVIAPDGGDRYLSMSLYFD